MSWANAKVRYEIAIEYRDGVNGKPQDEGKYIEYLTESLGMHESVPLLTELANFYADKAHVSLEGEPVGPEYLLAHQFWERAAELGDGISQSRVMDNYAWGIGLVKLNLKEAIFWGALALRNEENLKDAELIESIELTMRWACAEYFD